MRGLAACKTAHYIRPTTRTATMSKFAIIGVCLAVAAWVFFSMWKERRSERWARAGRCYQCGAPFGFEFKLVNLRFKRPSPNKTVTFCYRCARHRVVWAWLVGILLTAFVVILVWSIGFSTNSNNL
jgi:hypothetical protein